MKYTVEELRFLSSDGTHKVYAKIMIPGGKPKGIIQICHGMNGYIGKYDYVAKRLLEEGYAVCGHTSIGHYDSINSEDELGFFGEFNGYKYLISDTRKLTQIIKKKLPNTDIFLFGHSMGSFIARCYISKYGADLKGAIFSGTCAPQPLAESGIQLANAIIQKRGYKYRSVKLYSMLFQYANSQIKKPKTNYDWVSTIRPDIEDEKSDFLFTVTGLRDVLELIKKFSTPKEMAKIPRELPLYFFAGTKDPVADYGDGVRLSAKIYKIDGIKDVRYKLYKDNRHECLSEPNKDIVIEDMINWINEISKR